MNLLHFSHGNSSFLTDNLIINLESRKQSTAQSTLSRYTSRAEGSQRESQAIHNTIHNLVNSADYNRAVNTQYTVSTTEQYTSGHYTFTPLYMVHGHIRRRPFVCRRSGLCTKHWWWFQSNQL